jgi:hypothetical protein
LRFAPLVSPNKVAQRACLKSAGVLILEKIETFPKCLSIDVALFDVRLKLCSTHKSYFYFLSVLKQTTVSFDTLIMPCFDIKCGGF